MTEVDVIDAVAEEVSADERSAALAVQPEPAFAVTPTVTAKDLTTRLDVIREASETAMTKDVDYGVIPGTNKPTLLKPGAEKLAVLFQLDVQIDNEKVWESPHLTVISKATVYHAPTGSRVGYGEGICTTREKKYAKRKQERVCPDCGKPAVIKGKAEYGGGWLCFKKKDGCGHKWADGAPEIESQQAGEIENPDLPDTWNTVVKMAEKRARVDAILAVTGASALFTQDAEDMAPRESKPHNTSAPPKGAATDEASKFLTSLLKKQTLTGPEKVLIDDWLKAEQQVWQKQPVSAAIDWIKDGQLVQLLQAAGSTESDLPPADTDGL